jgi:DNA (cytosine-5)-methyltransferase 1
MNRPSSPSLARPPGPLVSRGPPTKRLKTLADLWKVSPVRETVAVLPAASTRAPLPGIPIVDLFCGAGGFSCGAMLAGHHVALAIDCDVASLKIHKANHPHAAHARMLLGAETEDLVLELIKKHVPEHGPWLLHGSPPCIKFSSMRNATKGKSQIEGMKLVKWYIELVHKLKPPVWTFEQVSAPEIRDYLKSLGLTYHVFNFKLYGVPQTRTRCLSGTTQLIHTLRDDKSLLVRKPATPATVLNPPPTATQLRASGGKCIERFYRPLDVPAWCLLTACKPVFVDACGKCVRVLTSAEILTLQTFPVHYRMPPHLCTEADRVRLIGNAVPPLMSRLLLRPLATLTLTTTSDVRRET